MFKWTHISADDVIQLKLQHASWVFFIRWFILVWCERGNIFSMQKSCKTYHLCLDSSHLLFPLPPRFWPQYVKLCRASIGESCRFQVFPKYNCNHEQLSLLFRTCVAPFITWPDA